VRNTHADNLKHKEQETT